MTQLLSKRAAQLCFTEEAHHWLNHLRETHCEPHVRSWAHAVLLDLHGCSCSAVSRLLDVTESTVAQWIALWREFGQTAPEHLGPNKDSPSVWTLSGDANTPSLPATQAANLSRDAVAARQAELPLVSVGMPCYNRPDSLARILEIVRAQTYSNLDIIVSDNASPDPRVPEIIRAHQRLDPRIRAFRQQENVGLIRNHDYVKARARGDLFLWVHDDDEIPENYIEECVKVLQDNPQATLVGPSCDRYLDEQYWKSYDDWDTRGQSPYQRLDALVRSAFNNHWRFEQYFSGVFRLAAAPHSLSPHFKSQFHLFCILSEAGEILNVPTLKLKKYTTHQNLHNYATGHAYKRLPWLKPFGARRASSMQQCVPITAQMMDIVWRSQKLSWREKLALLQTCSYYFLRHPVANEVWRIEALRGPLNALRNLKRKRKPRRVSPTGA
jgi:glycosyltransferase involved in cell wall biosynthesis/transposase-like protein